jgi:phosphate transport system substrate-binding protein
MKNSSWCALLAAVIGIGCVGLWADAFASAEVLKVQGSAGFADEVMRPYQAKVEALTGHKLSILATTADRGLLALLQGDADLAMIAAPLEVMVAPLRKSRPDLPVGLLRDFRIAKSRVAFPVNPDNPVRSVPVAKLKQLLNGQLDNWRQLGGPDLPIHVVSLRGDNGPTRATEEAILGGQSITPHSALIVENAQEIVRTIARDRGAIGFTPASFAKLHGLPVLQTNISVMQSYGFVTRNEPTDAMREVIAATRSLVFEEEP